MKGTCSMWIRGAMGVALVMGIASVASAQGWKPGSKTPDGQPDLQGMYILFDPTPFEAPGAQAYSFTFG